MNKKLRYLLYAAVLGIIVIVVLSLNKSESEPTKQELVHQTLTTDAADKITSTEMGLLYILNKNELISLDPETKSRKVAYKATGEIIDYYPSPSGRQAIVAALSNEIVKNYLVDLTSGNFTETEQCLAQAITWQDEDSVIANCFIENQLYDPNTVNSIVRINPKTKVQSKITDLQSDPPKSLLLASDEQAVLVPESSGYGSNNLMKLNLSDGKISSISDNGYISNAKPADTDRFIIETQKYTEEPQLALLDASANKTIDLADSAFDLTSYSNSRLARVLFTDGPFLAISSASSPLEITRKIDLSTLARPTSIIFRNSSVFIATPEGISKVDNI